MASFQRKKNIFYYVHEEEMLKEEHLNINYRTRTNLSFNFYICDVYGLIIFLIMFCDHFSDSSSRTQNLLSTKKKLRNV